MPLAARADGDRAPSCSSPPATAGSSWRAAWSTTSSGAATSVEASAEGDGARVVVHADARAGRVAAAVQVRRLPLGAAGAGRRPRRRASTARSTARRATATTSIEAAHRRHVEEFWGRSDVELERRAGRPAGRPLQPLPAAAGHRARRGPRRARQGRDRARLRGPLLLGHRDLRRPVPGPHDPAVGQAGARASAAGCSTPRANARARSATRGALFPWRTINGQEASAWYAAGTAQYHINADIAYAMHQYNRVTGDLGFLLDQGAEVLVETARLWMDLGFFSERRDGRFCINGVTGPDEYTTVVDNNAYTNLMAQGEPRDRGPRARVAAGRGPGGATPRWCARPGSTDAEVDGWRRAAERMYVPRHEQLGIVLQDEHFLDRKRWDFDGTPAEQLPAAAALPPARALPPPGDQADRRRARHLPRRTTTSATRRSGARSTTTTRSRPATRRCRPASRASSPPRSATPTRRCEYFLDACAVDLLDTHGNTADGIHIASCGGTWLALVAGFGGLRDSDGEVRFHPRLPAEWERLRFRVQVRGQLVEVDMTHEATTYRLLEGSGLLIGHFGEALRLNQGEPVRRPVPGITSSRARLSLERPSRERGWQKFPSPGYARRVRAQATRGPSRVGPVGTGGHKRGPHRSAHEGPRRGERAAGRHQQGPRGHRALGLPARAGLRDGRAPSRQAVRADCGYVYQPDGDVYRIAFILGSTPDIANTCGGIRCRTVLRRWSAALAWSGMSSTSRTCWPTRPTGGRSGASSVDTGPCSARRCWLATGSWGC